jgi:hypothetical protein
MPFTTGKRPAYAPGFAAEVLNLYFEKYGHIAEKDFLGDYRTQDPPRVKTVMLYASGDRNWRARPVCGR